MYTKTAAELLKRLKNREIGAEELTRLYLDRIQALDGPSGLNTVAELNEHVLEEAREMDAREDRSGALFGLPLLIKDNIDVAGLHTTAGSLALADNLAEWDAPVVARLRKAGALILGKTNMTEMANYMAERMPGGYSSRGGQVLHAYNREKNPGGSSSGSGVAVSAGLCAAAIGTDTSFSIVGCANINGVAGFKPAHGSLPGEGIVPISSTLDTAGPMTRNVADALLIYSAMREAPLPEIRPLPAEKLRLGVNIFHRKRVSEEQCGKIDALIAALRIDGALVEEVNHPHKIAENTIMQYEFQRDLDAYLAGSRAGVRSLAELIAYCEKNPQTMLRYGDAVLREALEASQDPDKTPYLKARARRKRLRKKVLKNLENYDAALMTGHTGIMHFTGLPSVAVPLGMGGDGTPMGIILYGKDEAELLSAALTVEAYCGPVAPPGLPSVRSAAK